MTSVMPMPATRLRKTSPYTASRSLNAHRGAVSSGKASMTCCAVHSAVGCSVTLKWTIRRRWCASSTKTNRTRPVPRQTNQPFSRPELIVATDTRLNQLRKSSHTAPAATSSYLCLSRCSRMRWLSQPRRLLVRYHKWADIHEACLSLGYADLLAVSTKGLDDGLRAWSLSPLPACAPPLESASPMPLSAGTRLGPYEIVAPLGAGGMGEVYRAR